MASARFRLSALARRDLDRIFDYTVETFGPSQALSYVAALKNAASVASEFPEFGRRYITAKGKEFRRYNAGRHALFYVPDDDGIFVVRILHGQMDFDRHL